MRSEMRICSGLVQRNVARWLLMLIPTEAKLQRTLLISAQLCKDMSIPSRFVQNRGADSTTLPKLVREHALKRLVLPHASHSGKMPRSPRWTHVTAFHACGSAIPFAHAVVTVAKN